VIGRVACRNGSAVSADRHPERSTYKVDHLASPSRRHSLRRITSCSISLSSVRSATIGGAAYSPPRAAVTSSPRMALSRHVISVTARTPTEAHSSRESDPCSRLDKNIIEARHTAMSDQY
jgi:hypothetical protein